VRIYAIIGERDERGAGSVAAAAHGTGRVSDAGTGARVRIALLGAGSFGRKHVELVRAEPSCALAGIGDPSPAARELAASLGVPWHSDPRALLAAERPQGAIVAAPNALHASLGIDCAERGIPVLVEKPIADSVEAAERLTAAARAAGVPLLVGHHRRHNPLTAAAREIVQGGRLGRLLAVAALWLVRKPDEYFDASWRVRPEGGPLLINLVHDVDTLRFICGEVAEVAAFTARGERKPEVEQSAAVALRFACGALGTFTISDAAPSPWSWELTTRENPAFPSRAESCYVFAGTEAALDFPRLRLWRYGGAPDWGRPLDSETLTVPPGDPLPAQLRHFVRVIRGEEPPRVSGEDATRTLAVTLAIRSAAASGQAVVP
jgi:predicted dehydrogenase